MTPVEAFLQSVKEYANEVSHWRSDDFGHDTQALQLAESVALQTCCYHIETLISIIDVYEKALNKYWPSISTVPRCPDLPTVTKLTDAGEALAEAKRIVEGSEE